MKQIFLVFALAFAFTTGMAVVTVVAQMDQAQASDAAVSIAYPAWNGCGNCALRGVYPALPVPYETYSPDTVWVPATDYPYVPGFARPYYGRYAFHDPAYMNPRYQHVPH